MRKTIGITKYELEWQLLRVSIKGSNNDIEKLPNKLDKVFTYFKATNTYDRWERCFNWIEGLERGFKASNSLEQLFLISKEKEKYLALKNLCKEKHFIQNIDQLELLSTVEDYAIKKLWIDLFKTNSKWLIKGYKHEECNQFMDWLHSNKNLLIDEIKESYSYRKLLSLRENSIFINNSHKFFF